MRRPEWLLVIGLFALSQVCTVPCCAETAENAVTWGKTAYRLYPERYIDPPSLPSPLTDDDGREILTCYGRDTGHFLVSVTVENGDPLDYRKDLWRGKGRQLAVDSLDFPSLAHTGLHSEIELKQTRTITGLSVEEITRTARPSALSSAGFVAPDEDILGVLMGDNRIVARLGLTHPQCARPLFHLFNVIQVVGRDSERGDVDCLFYSGRKIDVEFWGHKGWQESIFDDEILGYWEIEIQRVLDHEEEAYLHRSYPDLDSAEMELLKTRLTHIHTGEMVPFYVMRYGFYEGHTAYRADPIAIAYIFGLRSLEEIESAFAGRLSEILTDSFGKSATEE